MTPLRNVYIMEGVRTRVATNLPRTAVNSSLCKSYSEYIFLLSLFLYTFVIITPFESQKFAKVVIQGNNISCIPSLLPGRRGFSRMSINWRETAVGRFTKAVRGPTRITFPKQVSFRINLTVQKL